MLRKLSDMRVLYFDCFSGISGDMTVGALCDLGVAPQRFAGELAKLGVPELKARFAQDQRGGIAGQRFIVDDPSPADHGHHRTYADIRALLAASALDEPVKRRALAVFARLARAEAKIHGVALDAVHFHEIGALDSLADIVGTCIGLAALGVGRVVAAPPPAGRGWTECSHGRIPLPAPATLEILAGIPVLPADEEFEFVTPTGAAILAEFAVSFGPPPAMTIGRIGYGIGSRELPGRPNVLRLIVGETADADETAAGYAADTMVMIETNLDDLSPELAGPLIDRLLAAGAVDAFLTPVQMKKNRPGILLSALCDESKVRAVADAVFAESSAFGLRFHRVDRLKLARDFTAVATPYGEITVKIGRRGTEVLQVAPEFESCRAAADRCQIPLRRVYEAALAAYRAGQP